jgi:hypothetical protein
MKHHGQQARAGIMRSSPSMHDHPHGKSSHLIDHLFYDVFTGHRNPSSRRRHHILGFH